MNNLAFLVALHSIDGLGPIRLKKLLDYFEDPKIVWEANSKEFLQLGIPKNTVNLFEQTRKKIDPENEFLKLSKNEIKVKTIFDDDYPKRLKQIYDPPTLLYYKGEFLPTDERAIGVVGTRKITGYGRTVTEKLTRELVESGLTIVSGLARGVDTTAHISALNSNGRTIACLGGGLNRMFPPENLRLSQKIADGNGVVLSEYPPDYPSLAGNFPSRNRIIAGLSIAVLVTEAAEDSGSLITARLAIDMGREVFAIPGPITSSLSQGPSSLIKDGAKLVTNAQDILEELGMERVENAELRIQNLENLNQLEIKIMELLENEEKHIDEISRELKKPSFEISASLIKLEISGLVKSLGSGQYVKNI